MKKLLFFLSLVISFTIMQAQCPIGNINLTSQAEVDAFPSNCNNLLGNLTIEGANITNIDALSNLNSIGGYLRIDNNDMLNDIDGLINLNYIGDELFISRNNILSNIDGLNNLNYVGQELRILLNDMLNDIDGLINLNHVGRGISIRYNKMLNNIDGLININYLNGGVLYIEYNDILNNIDGLINLYYVEGFVYIANNDILNNIDGLINLNSVDSYVFIENNANLENINGFINLNSVGGFLRIINNDMLSMCCGVFPVIDINGISGNITIENNLPDCNSSQEILSGCRPICIGELETRDLKRKGALSAINTDIPTGDGLTTYTWYNADTNEVVDFFIGNPYYSPSTIGNYYVIVKHPMDDCFQKLGPRIINKLNGCCDLD